MGFHSRPPSRSSSSIHRPVGPYFPRAEANNAVKDALSVLPERPTEVGPILDEENYKQPIPGFDSTLHEAVYTNGQVPVKPSNFADPYLFPTLSQNERLRLTMLWYYTKGINEDEELLHKLQSTLDMIREFMGWQFAIIGILDEAYYTRLAASNLPIAILPRREGTCSHTINQKPGSVFNISTMATDWRFENSPHVKLGGLRSYAGTQLRVRTDSGDEVCLGSLCIASNTERSALSPQQESTLVWFADMLSEEIVNRTRRKRQAQRRVMTESLALLRSCPDSEAIELKVVEAVSQIYPEASVCVKDAGFEGLVLDGITELVPEEVHNGLWENSEYIESVIQSNNHRPLQADRPVRAVLGRCGRSFKFLVVCSSNVQTVYDDFDAWFIEKCGLIIADVLESRALKEALEAKQTFLRGITHQLRTPIHGILGSADLLAEELASMELSKQDSRPQEDAQPSTLSYLATIKSSGKELMSTVNNILKLNTWTDTASMEREPVIYDLTQLESDVLSKIFEVLTEEGLEEVSILFKNEVSSGNCIEIVEPRLLVECVQSLVINALQATPRGTVTVVTSTNAEYSRLIIDVIDTGSGIPVEDQDRIFEPYFKCDNHRPGAGLGLTISAKIATLLNGSVTLISSERGTGSHFRVEFQEMFGLCSRPGVAILSRTSSRLPKHFRLLSPSTNSMTTYLSEHLQQREFQSGLQDSSLIIIPPDINPEDLRNHMTTIPSDRVVVCITPPNDIRQLVEQLKDGTRTLYLSGPFHSARLDQFLTQADKIYQDLVPVEDLIPPVQKVSAGCENVVADQAAQGQSNTSAEQPQAAQTPLALLVDDNPINLRILRMYCEKRNIPCLQARDGNEAIERYTEALSAEPITLILMDLQMPNCDGITACNEIRSIEASKGVANSTIFIITGQDSPADRTRSMEAGADVFLVKPVSIKTLDQRLSQHIRNPIEKEDIGK